MFIITYKNLCEELAINGVIIESSWDIPYQYLLGVEEWINFRLKVLERDNHRCLHCDCSYLPASEDLIKLTDGEIIKDRIFRSLKSNELDKSVNNANKILKANGVENLLFHKEIKEIEKYTRINTLHVHHTHYVYLNQPWEYPLGSLESVCVPCHSYIHRKTEIPVYTDNSFVETKKLTSCPRCGGSGHLDEYSYYMDGVCFECNGRKYIEHSDSAKLNLSVYRKIFEK